MKKRPNLIVLTDHSTHSEHNSLYAIVQALHKLNKFATIDIASRGIDENRAALMDLSTGKVLVHSSTADFKYGRIKPDVERNLHASDLSMYDFMLLRIPRPLPDGFFNYLISHLSANRIFNNPLGIEKTGSKKYLLNFPELIPPTALCHDIDGVFAFAQAYDTVIKPLNDYGGHGIMRINNKGYWDGNKQIDKKEFTRIIQARPFPVLAMKFLENVYKGDKRILVAGNKVLTSTLRIPGEGKWLCNVAQGGRAETSELTDRENTIVKTISKHVNKEGIVLYGIDTLEDGDGKRYLSEINTLSIGGIGPADELLNEPISPIVAQELWKAMQRQIEK